MRTRMVELVLWLVVLSPAAWAGKHPVPLEAKTDGAKCLECHEDKTKGKAVHSAIATGCLSCHEVRVIRDVTRVKLITATPVKLCLQCHADKDAAQITGRVHSPAVRDCLKCHDPHTAANKNQLLKATSGGKDENLCLTCHSKGLDVSKAGSRHAALDMGCDTCHTTHKTGDPAKREFKYHLTKNAPALCLDCHDPKDQAIAKAHRDQPMATADCLTCHDPHQSTRPKLMQAFVHMPFAEKQCETCHQPAKGGKVVLTAASPKELCVTCHADKAEQIEKAKVQHPGAQGDCTDCHNPHAGKTPGFVRPDPVSACLTCHAEQAEMQKKKVLHQPAFQQGCATCHEPHGGDRPKLLRAEGNGLCLQCHLENAKTGKLASERLVTIFDGKVRLPENYFDKVHQFPIKYGRGHPTARHPVASLMDPADVTKVRTEISCMTCHQPHAGAAKAMLIGDLKPGMQFCRNCHKTAIGVQQ
ncbi:MAG: cytochrome c3 family protein [Terriglobales bacterium]